MAQEEKMQKHLITLLKYYCEYDNTISKLNLEIKITNSIYKSILECNLTHLERKNFEEQRKIIEEHNGQALQPNKERKNFIIFISTKQITDDLLYVETLFHELTHVVDFYNFIQEDCNGDYSKIKTAKEFPMFYYWTEFNAKKIGYKLYRNYLDDFTKLNMNDQEIINHMKTTEVEYQNENLLQELNDYSDNFTKQLYFTFHYLARYSVWESIEPEYFKDGRKFPYWLDITFKGRILELYNLLKEMNNYNKAKERFDKLESIIKDLIDF